MHRSDFSYDLPKELIAQAPLPERSASRLLCLEGVSGALLDRQFIELPALLRADDLLVFNDTQVVPARLQARKATGGQVEILLERAAGVRGAWVQMRASKPLRIGAVLDTAGGPLTIEERRDDLFLLSLPTSALDFFERHGSMPLPPYIRRDAASIDNERYQSIFARAAGAVAAPTASLHFDTSLLARIDALGVERAFVTLHVGAGTFQPVRVQNLAEHRMHAEWLDVSAATLATVRAARAAGRRVIAVGTTVVRALESAAAEALSLRGETRLFITPGYRFRLVDAMITNFHLPESTLLMLVAAFAGWPQVLAAYQHAVRRRYRFFSYGDAMWVSAAGGVHAV